MQPSDEDLERRVERSLSHSRWRSADPVLARLFEASAEQSNRCSVRRGVRAAVLCFLCFGLFDLWLLPDVGSRGALTRVAVGLCFLGMVEWRIVWGHALRKIEVLCALGLIVASLSWVVAVRNTAHQEEFLHFSIFGTVFVISSSLFFRFRFLVGAVCSSIITVIFCLAAVNTIAPVSARVIVVIYYVNFLGFSLYLSWQLAVERYVTFLNATRARINEAAAQEKGRQLSRIANTDHLTGLPNRRAIVHEYGTFRENWNGNCRPIGVVIIDVDHFKVFNDHYGHQSGDSCLVAVGHALQNAAAEVNAILGRYGGEEFLAFCHVADEAALIAAAERMRSAVEALALPHSERDDGAAVVTVSIGATISREGASPDLNRLSGEADKALYLAKAGGRNRTCLFDPSAPLNGTEDRKIAELLTHAVADDLLSLVYQPLVALADNKMHSLEALMRLRDVDGTAIGPNVFIPIAERTGSIVELGRWAIRTACLEILASGIAKCVSVNVSAVQLRAPGFPLYVAALMSELNLQPSALALEVTEGIDITSDPTIADAIRSLKALGVQIWLDDFGTGYAGLSWLQTVDFDVVKIDRSFLHRGDTREGAEFLTDMLQFLRQRSVSIVVEGVETEEQLAFIRKNGVPIAQGYLLCRPMRPNVYRTEIAKAGIHRAVDVAGNVRGYVSHIRLPPHLGYRSVC